MYRRVPPVVAQPQALLLVQTLVPETAVQVALAYRYAGSPALLVQVPLVQVHGTVAADVLELALAR